MDLKKTRENLSTYLEGKQDPEEIRLITETMKTLDEAIASDIAKSELIQKQTAELKEFFLHSTVTRENPNAEPAPQTREPRSFEEILAEHTKGQ